jgi:hypothetical protein
MMIMLHLIQLTGACWPRRVTRDHKVFRENRDHEVFRDHKVFRENRDHEVFRVFRENRDHKVSLAPVFLPAALWVKYL